MKLRILTCVFALVSAGCDRAPTEPAEPELSTPETQIEVTEPAPEYVECVVDYDRDDLSGTECGLNLSNVAGAHVLVKYGQKDEENYTRPVTMDVISASGEKTQTIIAQTEEDYNLARLQDLNGDGVEEILLPLLTGNVNTAYAVWHRQSAEVAFVKAGEISGVSFESVEPDYFKTTGRASAASWVVTLERFEGDTIKTVTTAEIMLSEDGGVESCSVFAGDEQSEAAAFEQFKDELCAFE